MCPSGSSSAQHQQHQKKQQLQATMDRREPTAVVAPPSFYLAAQHQQHLRATTSSQSPSTSCKTAPQAEEDAPCCRHCGSRSLLVDWAQGDKVCTHCGVVAEEKLREEGPEWREFNEAEDLAKGLASAARCGMVPVDESRYLGGLQPTTMSKVPFGGHVAVGSFCSGTSGSKDGTGNGGNTAARVAMIRKRLLSTNKKLDHMMGQHHARALRNARISRLVRKRQLQQKGPLVETDVSDLESIVTTGDEDIRPDLEQILIREEEDAARMQTALNADKWSLRRAILLHGNHETLDDPNAAVSERDDLQSRLDSKLRKAAADLYQAYQMLGEASRRLQLPDRVTHEATTMLCRYAARRDGFTVKGVSSRLTIKKANLSAAQQKQAAESLREHNKLKQIGSLCAALLVLTARKLGWPRQLTEVCSCVHDVKPNNTNSNKKQQQSSMIKPKHCFRAMDEVKSTFPDYARSVVAVPAEIAAAANNTTTANNNMNNDPASTIHFVDHAVRKLQLPPVAEASIRALVWHSSQEQHTTGQHSGIKLSTICASLAYFVCLSGSVMQQLASQAQMREQQQQQHNSKKNGNVQRVANKFRLLNSMKSKKRKASKSNNSSRAMPPPARKKSKLASMVKSEEPKKQHSTKDSNDNVAKATMARFVSLESTTEEAAAAAATTTTPTKAKAGGFDEDDSEAFDVFSHAVGSELMAQKREYEMRRVWDAWVDQTSWLRSLSEVEQSSGVASSTIMAHYKANVYPRRQALLEWLRDAVVVGASKSGKEAGVDEPTTVNNHGSNILLETPLATILLSHVVAAAPLLDPSGKQD